MQARAPCSVFFCGAVAGTQSRTSSAGGHCTTELHPAPGAALLHFIIRATLQRHCLKHDTRHGQFPVTRASEVLLSGSVLPGGSGLGLSEEEQRAAQYSLSYPELLASFRSHHFVEGQKARFPQPR